MRRAAAALGLAAALLCLARAAARGAAEEGGRHRSPLHLALSADGRSAYVVNQTAGSVSVLDVPGRRVLREIRVGGFPAHAALSPDGATLYVSDHHGDAVLAVDLARGRVARRLQAGRAPYGLALSTDGARLFVVNAVSESVSVLDAATGRRLREVRVGREPRYLALAPDGRRLVVANGLSRDVSVVDADSGRVLETRSLGRASILRQAVCSADGRWAFVAHLVSHDEAVTVQMERGFIHANGFSILDLDRPERRAPGRGRRVTLLLDTLLDGAANPWGAALSPDGSRLYVTLSGVHEVAVVDAGKALELADRAGPEEVRRLERDVEALERTGFARRVASGGVGPRGIAVSAATGEVLVAHYFSDSVSVLDGETGALRANIPLGPEVRPTLWRKGESLFNDGRLTYQRWFSCASCHQEDATVDGLNWDLTNDGVGNPKNAKSLHDISDTPPAMWTEVREDMKACVAAGQRFAGFLPDPDNQKALLAYIGEPRRAPNPYRRGGTDLAEGKRLFTRARCAACHPPPAYSDRRMHDLGLRNATDLGSRFDTPSLRECYRTAPYLHDGSAATLEDIFLRRDPLRRHGEVHGLSREDFRRLMDYVRSL